MTKNLLPLLFSFKGRIQRLYWWVATIAVGAVAGIVTTLLEYFARSSGAFIPDPSSGEIAPTGIFGAAITAIGLANLWINLALSVKRLHDRDRTGAWVFLQILLVFLAVIMIVVAIAAPKRRAVGDAGLAHRRRRLCLQRLAVRRARLLARDARTEPLRSGPARQLRGRRQL